MELSERYIKTLEETGYTSISEEQYTASEQWSDHTNDATKIIMVTDGSLTLLVAGTEHHVATGGRYSIPPHMAYEASAGSDGVIFITGEQSK